MWRCALCVLRVLAEDGSQNKAHSVPKSKIENSIRKSHITACSECLKVSLARKKVECARVWHLSFHINKNKKRREKAPLFLFRDTTHASFFLSFYYNISNNDITDDFSLMILLFCIPFCYFQVVANHRWNGIYIKKKQKQIVLVWAFFVVVVVVCKCVFQYAWGKKCSSAKSENFHKKSVWMNGKSTNFFYDHKYMGFPWVQYHSCKHFREIKGTIKICLVGVSNTYEM